jgi:transposase-like protein
MGKTGRINKRYNAEFKISVILDMRKNHLSYKETMRKYFSYLDARSFNFLKQWERIYLEEGAAGFAIERRGRATKMDNSKKGRPKKLNKSVENDLIGENQQLKERNEYLEMENEYLKKLDALVRENDRLNGKKRK